MLSAATDIIESLENNSTPLSPPVSDNTTVTTTETPLVPACHETGTGTILLADVLPTLVVKLTAPFFMQLLSYNVRISLAIIFGAISFPTVAFTKTIWGALLGVVCASLASGFGEITFLSLTSHFHKDTVSTWSSGTGGAGLFGSLLYLGLRLSKVSPKTSLLIMLFVPVLMAFSYFVLLKKPNTMKHPSTLTAKRVEDNVLDIEDELHASEEISDFKMAESHEDLMKNNPSYSFKEKMLIIVPLLKYMIPLTTVYIAEYFINQTTFELIFFNDSIVPRENQYTCYQALYQAGVFISRSSVNLIKIRHIWIFALLQIGNVALFSCQILFGFIPSIWIVFAIIVYEGLLGGGAYVNTFYQISVTVPKEHREFSMGIASVGDSLGIAVAGGISIPAHTAFCKL